ncbi:MAG: amidase [Acidobacteria bacterium]|nr:amidase [Acidobacteriota bacterium]
MTDVLLQDASTLVAAIAAGAVSAREAVGACLDRIAEVDADLNAFVDVRAEEAMREAQAFDDDARRISARGVPARLLGGVPVTVKSAIEVAGLRCETGSPSRLGVRARVDAVAAGRLRAAGAIVLGTTNVAEMLMGYETVNPLHGTTRNPWDLTRTPGGSSGGESAAIAAGCSFAGLGSDGGGSIRVPAHFTGICGLKPTPGRVPSTGHQPACLGPFSLIGVVGPMARSVADLRRLLDVVAGWDAGDPLALPAAMLPAPYAPSREVWWFDSDDRAPTTPETRAAVAAAVAALAAQGYRVRHQRPAVLEEATELWDVFFGDAGEMLLTAALGPTARTLPIIAALHRERGPRVPLTALRFAEAWAARDRLRAAFVHELQGRMLVCPVAAIPAFRHGERRWSVEGHEVGYLDAMIYTQWCNILGTPAAVVPAGRSSQGLPIGVQVVGSPFMDAGVLDVAAAIERGGAGLAPWRGPLA